ncbi:hypothetical protein SCHPADRAFT_931389 [Schizopora paradoxa]|uniref:Uncharacterized protein n=1 Tax=Schizopora paradoxa TaxID=27342 RepID=A0A0H2RB36_9AGAM|nr:hypothetical protein SCHPADRAFT_931389 [Schizopora paradoxa]
MSNIYHDNEQRTSKRGADEPDRFERGDNAHQLLDGNDNMSLGNRLEKVEKKEREEEEEQQNPVDPTKAAMDQGNEPSRGAKIDKEIMEEEQEYLERKGKA